MLRYKDTKYLVSKAGIVINEQTGKQIKDQGNGRGYRKITMTTKGVPSQVYIHRIVAELYLPNPGNHRQVNHKDGNKSNNSYENLEWTDALSNIRHAIASGLFPKTTNYWNSKLTESGIQEILKLKKQGVKQYIIANRLKVSKSTVSEVITGKRHKALTLTELTLKDQTLKP